MRRKFRKVLSILTSLALSFELIVSSFSPALVYAAPTITWSSHTLSTNRGGMSATTVDGKVFLAGGNDFSNGSTSNLIEIYDSQTNSWGVDYLPVPRKEFAATSVGSKALFGGGWSQTPYTIVYNSVDIYDSLTNRWSNAYLSTRREGLTATTVGCKAIFAGGKFSPSTYSSVDIYDAIHNQWTTASLSSPRYGLAAVSADGRAFFAGGYRLNPSGISNIVDIYDSASNSWSIANLSVGRMDLAAASVGNKVLFAGGETGNGRSDVVDIYDTATNTWSIAHLSGFPTNVALGNNVTATTVGDLAFFHIEGSQSVNIYNATDNTWTIETMPHLRWSSVASSVGPKAIFAGSLYSTPFNPSLPDIADIAEVSSQPAPEPNTAAMITITHQIPGKELSGTGLIQDGDSCNWLVKVDYGDGSGFQEIERDGYDFALYHEYDNPGDYTVTVEVTDDYRNTTTETFIASIINTPPVASAGEDQTVIVNEQVFLDGSASSDPDNDPLTYLWTEDPSNPQTGVLSDPTSVSPSFTPTIAGTYSFSLVVNDGTVDSAPNTVITTVQTPSQAIPNLIDLVETFNLQQGVTNSLDAKLDTAISALDDLNENNDVAALNSLYAFINAAEAQRGNKITNEQADALISAAQEIIDSLNL